MVNMGSILLLADYPATYIPLNATHTTDGLLPVSNPKPGKYRLRNEVFLIASFPAHFPFIAVSSPTSSRVPFKYHCPIVVFAARIVNGLPWSMAALAVP